MSGWAVIPSIRVDDLSAAVAFYVEQLGFTTESDTTHGNVSLTRGDARIMLESAEDFYGDAYNAAIRERLGSVSPNALYMEADDLEHLHDAATAAGLPVIDPLADRPWGQAEFTVEDPFGNWLTFWRKRSS